MISDREFTCCFTGHRRLPDERVENIVKNLNDMIDQLIRRGVTNFLSGGALGFDLMAASQMVAKKKMGKPVRLIFALPCKDQHVWWSTEQQRWYQNLLAQADEIVYVSEKYWDGCMKQRNAYMVDRSAYCLCALLRYWSGTGQTVRYAEREGVRVVNVADFPLGSCQSG